MPEHTPAPSYARSLYGFFMYVASNIILFIYCAWALLPDYILHYFNIYYYPQKYWSVTVPIQLLLALALFAFLIYPAANLILSVNIDNQSTIIDSHGIIDIEHKDQKINASPKTCICKHKEKCMKDIDNIESIYDYESTIPHVQDLDIRYVCRKLYC